MTGTGLDLSNPAWASKCERGQNDARIINGSEVDPPHKYPFTIYIRSKEDTHGFSNCGGGLLSDRIVLTAAHCIPSGQNNSHVLKAGVHNKFDDGTLYGMIQKREMSWGIRHESYNSSIKADHDVGLILVDPPFEFNYWIAPIKLSDHETPPHTKLTVVGWGNTKMEDGTASPVLLEARTRAMSRAEAQPGFKTTLTNVNVVTRAEGSTSECINDSGSPLFNDDIELVGVVSKGNDKDRCYGPTAHTNISNYHTWILETKAKLEALLIVNN